MAKCKDCGEPLPTDNDLCPKCGLAPGAEDMSDFTKTGARAADKKLAEEIRLKGERAENLDAAECRSCGGPITEADELCPHCGAAAGAAETFTDFPRVDFKAARKKLKEEIKESREHEKE